MKISAVGQGKDNNRKTPYVISDDFPALYFIKGSIHGIKFA